MDWLDDDEEDDDEGTGSVAQALATPRALSAGEAGAVPSSSPQPVDQASSETPDPSEEQDVETSAIANSTRASVRPATPAPTPPAEDGVAPYMQISGAVQDDDRAMEAPAVPSAPNLPSAEEERDQLTHSIANFDPNAYKPSVGRRIAAGLAAGMAGFGHDPNAGKIGQEVIDAPLNRARAAEEQKEAALQQQIKNTEANRQDAQQGYNNRVSQFNLGERGMENAQRVADWKALADQRRAAAQKQLNTVDKNTLAPVDPNNPFGEWQGRTPSGKVVRGLAPPASVQKDPRYVMSQRRSELAQMQKDGIKLTPQETKYYLINGKLAEPSQHTTFSIRENPDGSAVTPSAPRGRGGSGGMNQSLHDRIIAQKNVAMTRAQEQHAAGLMDDTEYQAALQDAQDNFEQRIHQATGQQVPHVTVNDKFQFVTEGGGVLPPSSQPRGGAARPQQTAPQQPQRPQQPQKANVQFGNGRQLTDVAVAKQYLAKAGGDKNKARQLAEQDNWKF